MKLETFVDKIKTVEPSTVQLALSILKTEEILENEGLNTDKIIDELGTVLVYAMLFSKEHSLEINNKVPDLDLDNWKDKIRMYQVNSRTITKDSYLWSLRNSLRYLLDDKEQKKMKSAFFEVVAKTFLFIDYLHLSIDSVLEGTVKKISNYKKLPEEKKAVEPIKS